MRAHDLMGRLERLGVELQVRGDSVRARAPEGVLTAELREEIARHKDELVRLLESAAGGMPEPILPASPDAAPRLSPGQERIWRLVRRDPRSAAYNLCEAFRLGGALDRVALDTALAALAERHENLRTEIAGGAVPLLRVLPAESMSWRSEDLSATRNPLETARARAREAARTPFDLEKGPLARLDLFRLGRADHVVSIVMHHIVSDGWSLEVIYEELAALYEAACEGRSAALPPLPCSWVDVAAWQRAWSTSAEAEAARTFWREALSEPVEPLDLPGRAPPPRGYAGAEARVALPVLAREAVDRLSAAANASPFMVLLAAFACLLHERTGQEELLICAPAAGRERPELERVVGYLNNLLALRISLRGDPSFLELLARTRDMTLGAFRHRALPFQEIADLPHLARVPLTRAMLAYQGEAARSLRLAGLATTRLPVDNGTANFDLALYMARVEDGLDLRLSYKSGALGAGGPLDFLTRLSELLTAAARAPSLRISDLTSGTDSGRPPRAPSRRRPDDRGPAPALNPLEVQLMLTWERVLGVWPISLDDDFFDLGGHSLLAVRLLDEIETDLGRSLPLGTFFEVTTIRSLARALEDRGWVPPGGALVCMQSEGSGRPLFLVHSFEGHVFFYNELARSMAPEHPVHGLQAPGLDGRGLPPTRVESIAEAHLEEVRRVRPRGPYTIAAMCFGVAVALELGARLTAAGEQVDVVFLDSVLDGREARYSLDPDGPLPRFVREAAKRVPVVRQRLRDARASFRPGHYERRERRMRVALIRAWENYRPAAFEGTITLIRSQDNAEDPSKDWQAETIRSLTGAEVETPVVRDHHFALLREPNVRLVAGLIKDLMARTP